MEPAVDDLLTEDVLAEAARRFGAPSPEELPTRRGDAHLVVEYDSPAGRRVLRIGHSSSRLPDQVRAEVEYVEYLAQAGAPVAAPIRSRRHEPVEVVSDGSGGQFVVTGFSRAPGALVDEERFGWDPDLFREWGRVTGVIHRLGTDYEPSDPWISLPQWEEHPLLAVTRLIPESKPVVRAAATRHLQHLKRQPRDEGYGIVHGGLTQWSFAVERGRATVFDFAGAERCWLAKDIAVALFHARESDPEGHTAGFAERFLRPYLEGYRSEHRLPAITPSLFTDLLRLHAIAVYAYAHATLDRGELGAGQRRFLGGIRRALERNSPIVAGDFAAILLDA